MLDEPPAVRADIGDTYHPTFAGQGSDSRQYDEAVHRERERAYSAGRANVGRLADETGAHLWFSKKKNYADAMEALAKELKGQYLLSFAPSSAPANGPVHGLRLALKGRRCHPLRAQGVPGAEGGRRIAPSSAGCVDCTGALDGAVADLFRFQNKRQFLLCFT